MARPAKQSYDPILDAISFAARAHHGQIRKDGKTPYVSHVFRVCFILRDVFEIDDRQALTAAALHDTVEDTTTDFDDIEEAFGKEVASWVAALSKDKRLEQDAREAAYERTLADAPWQVQVCKLADVLDNAIDAATLPVEKRGKAMQNACRYLTALQKQLKPEARKAWEIVARAYEKATGSEGHFGLS
jgi:guanosine-3',5'-bis(diphosphate) 3'-pyrophosphohydrolase